LVKIPKQIYVTAKYQYEYVPNPDPTLGHIPRKTGFPLGFLHPWDPNKPEDKKHYTQREWAYSGLAANSFRAEDLSGHLWITGMNYKWLGSGHSRIDVPFAEWASPQPQVWDNTPLRGFKIEKSVTRYSTSNKLWRVLDPRGIEFEISTWCLEEIIMSAGILKGGEIDAECVWAANKNLMVA
jgi:hypothetical protein